MKHNCWKFINFTKENSFSTALEAPLFPPKSIWGRGGEEKKENKKDRGVKTKTKRKYSQVSMIYVY